MRVVSSLHLFQCYVIRVVLDLSPYTLTTSTKKIIKKYCKRTKKMNHFRITKKGSGI